MYKGFFLKPNFWSEKMIITEKNYFYKAFGLNIVSELPLPELVKLGNDDNKIDITIKSTDLSNQWSEVNVSNRKGFVVKENRVMFEVPNLAIFSIEEGKTINFSPIVDFDKNKIRLYLLGSCLGILLMQRKILPLHGSAIAVDGMVYVFIGESGAGKSTIASSFIKKGFQLLSDDVIAISHLDGIQPWVIPAYPQQKLWQDSLNHFGMKTENYKPLFDRETKFSIPVTDSFYNEPLPLGGIFELVPKNIEQIEVEEIESLRKFQILLFHTYRRSLIEKMNMLDWHFQYSAQCISKVPLYQICRPSLSFTTNELVDTVLNVIKGEKIV